jgi:hypothetical protein
LLILSTLIKQDCEARGKGKTTDAYKGGEILLSLRQKKSFFKMDMGGRCDLRK